MKKITLEEFVRRANIIHKGKYDYSLVVFKNTKTKISIICPKHGVFTQTPSNHLNGKGCPVCGNIARKYGRLKKREDVIADFIRVHGNEYDYSEFEYIDAHTPGIIICKIHGQFKQDANHHLAGCGCPKCHGGVKYSFEDFKEKSNEIHKNKYTYNDYSNNRRDNIKIVCPIHGEFEQTPDAHLQGKGCPKCGHIYSKIEDDIKYIIESSGFTCITHDRTVLNGKEIDIYIPELLLGIEYNGILWHSEKYNKTPNYHAEKLDLALSKGIRLITIFEDEWLEHKDLVVSKIKHIIGKNNDVTVRGARECKIVHITNAVAREFLEKYHIQGFGYGSVYYGAYSIKDNVLLGVMVFKNNREKWELTRFATNYKYSCPGLASKMFKTFIKEYDPIYVKSFADRRWTMDKNSNLYTKLKFNLVKITKPDYSYFFKKRRMHKFNFRKQKLSKKYGFPLSMTEKEMCNEIGAYRIWNCGLLKYVWQKKENTVI